MHAATDTDLAPMAKLSFSALLSNTLRIESGTVVRCALKLSTWQWPENAAARCEVPSSGQDICPLSSSALVTLFIRIVKSLGGLSSDLLLSCCLFGENVTHCARHGGLSAPRSYLKWATNLPTNYLNNSTRYKDSGCCDLNSPLNVWQTTCSNI